MHLLVPAIFVRSRGSPDHMSGSRLSDSLRHEPGQDGDVQDVAGGDECARGRRRELCKPRDGLLRGDKGAVDVDGRVAAELGERDREGIIGQGEVRYADYETSVHHSVDEQEIEMKTYRCRPRHWGFRASSSSDQRR